MFVLIMAQTEDFVKRIFDVRRGFFDTAIFFQASEQCLYGASGDGRQKRAQGSVFFRAAPFSYDLTL